MNTTEDQSATDKFKLYLNSIMNTIPDEVHNELWNHLIGCVVEKEKLKIALSKSREHLIKIK